MGSMTNLMISCCRLERVILCVSSVRRLSSVWELKWSRDSERVIIDRWRGEKDTVNEIGVDKANPDHVIVRIDPKYFRPTEVDLLIGDCTKAKTVLGWKKEVSFDQLVEEMVDCDMKSAESDLRFYKLGGDRMSEENEEFVVV